MPVEIVTLQVLTNGNLIEERRARLAEAARATVGAPDEDGLIRVEIVEPSRRRSPAERRSA